MRKQYSTRRESPPRSDSLSSGGDIFTGTGESPPHRQNPKCECRGLSRGGESPWSECKALSHRSKEKDNRDNYYESKFVAAVFDIEL